MPLLLPESHPTRPAGASVTTLALCLIVLSLLAGCGSKISEANYYRVQNGMDEDAVDDLLGPANAETVEGQGTAATTLPSTTSPTTSPTTSLSRKTKTWSRGPLTLSVVFEGGKVIARNAEGIPFESGQPRPPATGASVPWRQQSGLLPGVVIA